MKFLHLADLHLGKRVNGFDMLEDQRFILEQILTLCDKHGVEAVVLAGDIYDTPVPPAAACTLLDWFLTQLSLRHVPVLAVSGNHDSAERLDFASGLLAEQGVYIAGRFHGMPKQVVLHDRYGPLEFTLLPFVRAATVRHYLPEAEISDYDSAVGAALAVCEPAAPRRVLVAHQMVVSGVCPPQLAGSETAPLTVGTVDSIDAARFAGFCYAALGHIHRAQRVGIDAVRYAGSPLCYHLDECGMQKSATLVRIGKRGVEKIEQLPLTPRRAEEECKRLDDVLLMHVGALLAEGADEQTAAELTEMQADRDPFAAGAAAELGKLLLEADEANEKRQTAVMKELDEKIARGDAGLKIAEERAARRRQLAGLIAEEQRAADVEHQTDIIMADLEKRTASLKESIAKNEADRAALSQAEADLLKTDHRIELAEGLSADCRQLLGQLQDADKARQDAADRQTAYVAAQAALDKAEEEYSTLQRQLNANRAGLLARDLEKGKPCPVCGSTRHPKIAALPKDHITEKQLEEREKELTAQRRTTAAASRTAGDAAAHAHELRAALQRNADGFFARRGDRYTGKPAAELTPDELKAALTAQQESLAEGLRGLQADHLKLKQKTDRAKSLAKQADILTRQLAELDKQQFAATRRAANAKAGHAAATARVQQMQETMPKRDNPDALERLQEALARLRSDRAAAMDARDAAVHRLHTNRAALDALHKAMRESAAAREKRAMWDNLSKTINGNLTGKIKLPFEQYVQAFYFDGVVEAANLRFTRMTDGQYRLLRRRSEAVSGKTALDLDVFDAYTGKTRPVGSLSGGESFMAALSLALGISDTIQQNAGGVVIETLFIDEGFGSLDADSLEKAVDTLAGLAGGDKLIGVISHVEALQDRLTRQIRVTKTRAGSKAEIEIS